MKVWCNMCGDGCVNEVLGMCLDCGYHYGEDEYVEAGGKREVWRKRRKEDEKDD